MQPKSSAASAPRRGKPLATSCSRARLSEKKKKMAWRGWTGTNLPALSSRRQRSRKKNRHKKFVCWIAESPSADPPGSGKAKLAGERCEDLKTSSLQRSASAAAGWAERARDAPTPERETKLRAARRAGGAASAVWSAADLHCPFHTQKNFRKCTSRSEKTGTSESARALRKCSERKC